MTQIGWYLLFLLAALLEGLALAGHGTPMTEALRAIRYDPVGKFALLPFFTWMLWHIAIRPKSVEAFTWRDVVFIAAGLAWAVVETVKG